MRPDPRDPRNLRDTREHDTQRMTGRRDGEPRAEGSGELRVQPIDPATPVIQDGPEVRNARGAASAAPFEPGIDLGVDERSWRDIKSRFVDDPSGALAAAEELVRLAVDHKIRALKDEAAAICARDTGDASSTETLRTRLIDYQAYCERLARGSR